MYNSIVTVGQVINLVRGPVDLTCYSRVPACASAFIFKNRPRYLLVALQAGVELSIYNKGLVDDQAPHANPSAVFTGVDCVP